MQFPLYQLHQGRAPLLISIPHLGTVLPDEVISSMTPFARSMRDTDWHLDQLYAFASELGASILGAKVSRYVIDLNRPPDGASLYPGQTTTGLCPTETFRGEPLYLPGQSPDSTEISRRRVTYWQPYHDALQKELERLRSAYGKVLLWEAHSIATMLPRLFDGALPDLNFGTNGGLTCAPEISGAVLSVVRNSAMPFSHVLDGRFKGGYITRHYGQPDSGIHAIQLEMCQHLYMDEEPPFTYLHEAAARVQPVLSNMLNNALDQLSKWDRDLLAGC